MPTGTIGVLRLEREAHEAGAEALQPVALRVELVHAAHAFREHHHALAVLEHLRAVVGRPDQRRRRAPRATLTNGSFGIQYSPMPRAMRGGSASSSSRDAEHRRVERQLARVVRRSAARGPAAAARCRRSRRGSSSDRAAPAAAARRAAPIAAQAVGVEAELVERASAPCGGAPRARASSSRTESGSQRAAESRRAPLRNPRRRAAIARTVLSAARCGRSLRGRRAGGSWSPRRSARPASVTGYFR